MTKFLVLKRLLFTVIARRNFLAHIKTVNKFVFYLPVPRKRYGIAYHFDKSPKFFDLFFDFSVLTKSTQHMPWLTLPRTTFKPLLVF